MPLWLVVHHKLNSLADGLGVSMPGDLAGMGTHLLQAPREEGWAWVWPPLWELQATHPPCLRRHQVETQGLEVWKGSPRELGGNWAKDMGLPPTHRAEGLLPASPTPPLTRQPPAARVSSYVFSGQ